MGPFHARREVDPESGLELVTLRAAEAGQPAIEVRVAPHAGANLYHLSVDGEQLLAQPPTLAELGHAPAGTPILFPSPNRVRDSAFAFEGARYAFTANSGPNFIHGLVRRRPWRVEAVGDGPRQASATVAIDWDPAQPDFASFPVEHRLAVSYSVRRGRIGIEYRVENRGARRLPFGFGVHPWFRVPGDRRRVRLRVPASLRMEAEDRLPTGRLLGVASTPFDLRRPTALEGLELDDVYLSAPSAGPAWCEWQDQGLRLTLGASPDFTHVVVYTPTAHPVFCLENQTCSTDAHNLHARGFGREAHLSIVEPGASRGGALDWRIRRIPIEP